MSPKKNKGGRPRLPASEKRASVVTLRLQASERETLDEAAERAGRDLSAWMRDVLLRAARRRR